MIAVLFLVFLLFFISDFDSSNNHNMATAIMATHIPMEAVREEALPHFHLIGQPNPMDTHEVIFAVKQNNIPYLHDLLMNVSTPGHPQYGNHLSQAQVIELSQNRNANDYVKQYLLKRHLTFVKESLGGEYVVAKGSIYQLEEIFVTKFHRFQRKRDSLTFVRAYDYKMEKILQDHVTAVFNIIQFPTEFQHHPIIFSDLSLITISSVAPADLNIYYNISFNTGSSFASQAIFQSLENYYSPSDLFQFQETFGIPQQNVTYVVNGQASDSECYVNIDYCAEANLDVQYMIGLSQVTPTTYWYEPASSNTFVSWIYSVSSTATPPLVHSLSYGAIENQVSISEADSFNTEAMKLGLQGISIIVSTGDDGVANYFARTDASNCGYNPGFPSTSPYVTAIGSTQGPLHAPPEISSSILTGGVTTSGGGFSNYFPTPSYQQDAISNYFSQLSIQPMEGYNISGRGYPDLAFAGLNFQIIVAGQQYLASGTSASSPSMGALVSLVNSKRIEAGKSPLGFLNNAIYSFYSSFTNDILSSNNSCTADVCCSQGFSCTVGWDPVSGWGSINFESFMNTFMSF